MDAIDIVGSDIVVMTLTIDNGPFLRRRGPGIFKEYGYDSHDWSGAQLGGLKYPRGLR